MSNPIDGIATDFEANLACRFRSAAAADEDIVFSLAVESDAGCKTLTVFAVRDGELRFDPALRPDATFFFDSVDTALAILEGRQEPMAAFMAGRFRSDGNLPLAFLLLGLFRADYGVEAPP